MKKKLHTHKHLFMCVLFRGNAGGFTCCLGLHAELKIISHSFVHCFHGAAATFPIIPHGKSLDWRGAVGPVITTHPLGVRADLEQLTAHSFPLIRQLIVFAAPNGTANCLYELEKS